MELSSQCDARCPLNVLRAVETQRDVSGLGPVTRLARMAVVGTWGAGQAIANSLTCASRDLPADTWEPSTYCDGQVKEAVEARPLDPAQLNDHQMGVLGPYLPAATGEAAADEG
ncbi:MAG TPA: hypothetical protein VMB52_02380 [Verrucomicrobiae bacterium]|nr:hypothetical protein [Verrucomicrobiae bacterium]